MESSALLDIGRKWADIVGSVYRTLRDGIGGDPRIATVPLRPAPTVSVRTGASAHSLGTAGTALRAAFESLSTRTRAIYSTTLYEGSRTAATVGGVVARLSDVPGGPATLRTTVEVNTRTSTARSSWAAIGLDTTTPEASSRLRSTQALGLDVVTAERASTIQSTAEMNTSFTTSYGSSSLTFRNAGGTQTSTSTGTLTGTYTGTGAAANATSLTINVTQGDTIGGLLGLGEGNISFNVKDQNGSTLFTYSGSLGNGEQVYLGNDIGLSVSFSSGQLQTSHAASTTVTKTPITVDGNAAFNAGVSARPKFDGNAVVTAGSFTVNGTSITVNANDTINTVLARINSAAAGVTASLADDQITLASHAFSEDAIVLANDTSGFLSATKLSAATTTIGNVRDDQQILKKTSQFGAVLDGSFTINGVSIGVDRDSDTLSTIVNRINAAGAGVTASYNAGSDRVEIDTIGESEDDIVVGNDTSGFLTAARLAAATTSHGVVDDDEQVLADVSALGSVVDGSFEINGETIAVDVDADTILDVVAAINASDADVTASYDAATDTVTITPDVAGAMLTIGNDTSGLLSAINMATGTVSSDANPDGAFNGTGLHAPFFDSGVTVQAGSFEVNGVSIAVGAADTINTVLARITASAADVTATYDGATDTVTLTANQVTGQPITVGNDTSGFLAAVKLDGTAESVAQLAGTAYDVVLEDMPEYAAVAAGAITVNGQNIAVDPSTTTIGDLVAALDALPDVWASVDHGTGRITLGSLPGGSATISDTSGLLAVLGIAPGTYAGTIGDTTALRTQVGAVPENTADVVAMVAAAVDQMNTALSQFADDAGDISKAREAAAAPLEALLAGLARAGVAGFTLPGDEAPSLSLDREALKRALNTLPASLESRNAIASVIDEFTAAMVTAATPQVPAAPPRQITLELSTLPGLDPEAARSRMASARSAARMKEARRQEQLEAQRERPPLYEARERTNWTTMPPPKPGLFEGLFDGWFSRW